MEYNRKPMTYLARSLAQEWGTLALYKKMLRMIARASYVNPNLMPEIEIEPGDEHRPAPVRDRWPMVARRLSYGHRLGGIQVPTLVCIGKFDPQVPVACSEELAQR